MSRRPSVVRQPLNAWKEDTKHTKRTKDTKEEKKKKDMKNMVRDSF